MMSYQELIDKNINFSKTFCNEHQFTNWFRENYSLFGFDEIFCEYPSDFPDFVMLKKGKKINVELETISNNFISHHHNPEEVDLVICLIKKRELPVETVEISSFKLNQSSNRIIKGVSLEIQTILDIEKFRKENGLSSFNRAVEKLIRKGLEK